jgi:hypothetical protein
VTEYDYYVRPFIPGYVTRERQEATVALLAELYGYVVELESTAGGLLYTHGGALPESGDLGKRVRRAIKRPEPA